MLVTCSVEDTTIYGTITSHTHTSFCDNSHWISVTVNYMHIQRRNQDNDLLIGSLMIRQCVIYPFTDSFTTIVYYPKLVFFDNHIIALGTFPEFRISN